MKRKIFAVVCVLMLSASALTWAVGPEWIIADTTGDGYADFIYDDGCNATTIIYYDGTVYNEEGPC